MEIHNLQLYNADNLEVMATLSDESIDVICIDPPYLYLKNQKLERPFDEQKFFAECKRLLTKKGFIVMFGRGTSFYRWNTILDGLGFVFKEEVIWDKRRITSPALPLGRRHESISVYTKREGQINDVLVSYEEHKFFDIDKIVNDISRVESTLKKPHLLAHIKHCLKDKKRVEDIFYKAKKDKYKVAYRGNVVNKDVGIATLNTFLIGNKETSVISDFGVKYKKIHPTQKPVRLLERLLALVIPKDKPREEVVVADFFAGSMSCMEAIHNMGMKGIATEIDQEYFEKGKQRIEGLQPLIIN